jgi:hypothetical protein
VPALDEVSSEYGLLAEAVSYSNDFASNRDSSDEPRRGADFVAFRTFLQDLRAVATAATILRAWTAVGQPDLAVFPGIWAHSSRRLLLNA